jgi:hypothetical protein
MKGFLVLVLLLSAATAYGDIYTWNDARGTVHYTNSLDEIPARYLKKARVLDVATGKKGGLATAQPPASSAPGGSPGQSAAQPAPQPPPPPPAPAQVSAPPVPPPAVTNSSPPVPPAASVAQPSPTQTMQQRRAARRSHRVPRTDEE